MNLFTRNSPHYHLLKCLLFLLKQPVYSGKFSLICIVALCVLLSSYVYLFTVCELLFFILDAGLLARSEYSEGPATGHLDTDFSWFPCA